MSSSTEPRSGLKYGWALGESGWNTEMDANLLSIGRFGFHLSIKDRDLSTPPGSPAAGDTYIVKATGTGAWASHDKAVAIWDGSAWQFGTPREGWVAWIEDEAALVAYHSAAWSAVTTGGGADMLATLASAEISVTGAVTATISRMHVCSGTSADYTVTLPAASGNAGKLIGFRMAPGLTKLVTLDGNASETIDGALTRVLWAQESAILLCDGSNWFKISGKSRAMLARMSLTADQSCASGSQTTLILNRSDVDNTGLMCDATTNHLITIKRASQYKVSCKVPWDGITTVTPSRIAATIYAGANQIASGEMAYSNPTGKAFFPAPMASDIYAGSVGDTLVIKVYQDSGASQNAYGTTVSGGGGACALIVEELPSW